MCVPGGSVLASKQSVHLPGHLVDHGSPSQTAESIVEMFFVSWPIALHDRSIVFLASNGQNVEGHPNVVFMDILNSIKLGHRPAEKLKHKDKALKNERKNICPPESRVPILERKKAQTGFRKRCVQTLF